MIDRRSLLLGVSALTACVALSREARADEVDEVLAKISKARRSIKTLQAPFTQKRVIGLLATSVISKGQLTLVRPNRLRWELHPPDAVTYWIGPEGLAMGNKDGVTKVGKASAGRFASVLGDLLVMVGGDMRKLRKRYELTLVKSGGKLHLTAKPKKKDVAKHIAFLKLRTAKGKLDVERIEIHEHNGDESIIDFGKLTKNKPVKPAFMKPPK